MQRSNFRFPSASNILKTAALALALAAAALFWGKIAMDVLRILFGAALLAFLLLPLAKFYERKLKRSLAAPLALASTAGLILIAAWLLLPALSRQFSNLADTLPEAVNRLQALFQRASDWISAHFPGVSLPRPDTLLRDADFSDLALRTVDYAGSLAGSIYQFSLMLILSCYFIADRDRLLLRLELFIPSALRRMAVRMGNGILREFRLYIRGQALIALCVGTLSVAALMLCGVSGALLLGLIVGVFNLIPYLGPLLGSIPAVLTALSHSWQQAMFTIAALFLVQQVDSLVLSPRIMGSVTGFSPALVLLALYVGSRANGVWGMLFAMPLMMSLRTVYRVFVQRHENN